MLNNRNQLMANDERTLDDSLHQKFMLTVFRFVQILRSLAVSPDGADPTGHRPDLGTRPSPVPQPHIHPVWLHSRALTTHRTLLEWMGHTKVPETWSSKAGSSWGRWAQVQGNAWERAVSLKG